MNVILLASTVILPQLGIRSSVLSSWLKTVFAIAPLALWKLSSSVLIRAGIVSLAAYNIYVVCTHKKPPSTPRPPSRSVPKPAPAQSLPAPTPAPQPPPRSAPTQSLPARTQASALSILDPAQTSRLKAPLDRILATIASEATRHNLNLRWHGRGSLQRVFFEFLTANAEFLELWAVEENRRHLVHLLENSEQIFTGRLLVKDLFTLGLRDNTPDYLASSGLYYQFGHYDCGFHWEAVGNATPKIITRNALPPMHDPGDLGTRVRILREMYALKTPANRISLLQTIQAFSPYQLTQSIVALLRQQDVINLLVGRECHNDLEALGPQGYHWLSDLRRLLEIPAARGRACLGPEIAHALDIAHLSAMLYRFYVSSELDASCQALTTILSTAPMGFGADRPPVSITHFDVGRQYFHILIEQFQRNELHPDLFNALRFRLEAILYRICCLRSIPAPPRIDGTPPAWEYPALLPIPSTPPEPLKQLQLEVWNSELHSAHLWDGFVEIPTDLQIPPGGAYQWTLREGQIIRLCLSKKILVNWPTWGSDPTQNLDALEQFYYYFLPPSYFLFQKTREEIWDQRNLDVCSRLWFEPAQILFPHPPGFPLECCLLAALRVYLRILRLPISKVLTTVPHLIEESCLDWRNSFPDFVTLETPASAEELAAAWERIRTSDPVVNFDRPLEGLVSIYDHFKNLTRALEERAYPRALRRLEGPTALPQITDGAGAAAAAEPPSCLAHFVVPGAHGREVAPDPLLFQFESDETKTQPTLQRVYRTLSGWLKDVPSKSIETFVGHNGKPYTVEKKGRSITICCPVFHEDLTQWGWRTGRTEGLALILTLTDGGEWFYSLPEGCSPIPPAAAASESSSDRSLVVRDLEPSLAPEILLTGYCTSVLQQITAYIDLGMLAAPQTSTPETEMQFLWEGAKLLEARFRDVAAKQTIKLRNPILCSKDSTFEVEAQPLTQGQLDSYLMSRGILITSKKLALGRGHGRDSEGRNVTVLIGQTREGSPCAEFVIGRTSHAGCLGDSYDVQNVKRIRAVQTEPGRPLDISIGDTTKTSSYSSLFGDSHASVSGGGAAQRGTHEEIRADLTYLKQALGAVFAMLQSPYTIVDGAMRHDGLLHSNEALIKLALLLQGTTQNESFRRSLYEDRSPFKHLAQRALPKQRQLFPSPPPARLLTL